MSQPEKTNNHPIVEGEPKAHTVYISLGTNIGDREANLRIALDAMQPQVIPDQQSPVYSTEPWGYTEQPDFLNQVIRAQTALNPEQLLLFLKELEEDLGREPNFRYGPRLIDLDILFYDDQVLALPGLTIPHSRLPDRAFVLVPLADIAPDLRHPLTGETVREMLARVDASTVHPFSSSSQLDGKEDEKE